MSSRETDPDIGAFLVSINLGQYLLNFRNSGYHTLQECVGINDSVLQHIGISPTGHRRRILKHLEATFTKMPETAASGQSCSPKHLLDPKRKETGGRPPDGQQTHAACISNCERNPHYTTHVLLGNRASPVLDLDSSDTFGPNLLADPTAVPRNSMKNVTSEKKPCTDDASLKKGDPEALEVQLNAAPKDGSLSSAFSPTETKTSEVEDQLLSGLGSLLGDLQEPSFFEFKGEMVENDLYCTQSPSRVGTRPTRSFMLRHRPVPEIPGVSSETTSNSSLHERRSANGLSIHCSENCLSGNREPAEEKPPPISPYGETFLMNSPEDMEIYSKEPSEVLEEDKEKKRMPSRTGLATSNQTQKTSENVKDSELTSQGDQSPFPNRFVGEAESSLLKECSRYAWRGKYKPTKGLGEFKSGHLDLDVKDQMFSSPAVCGDELVPGFNDTITPYACFYAPAVKKVKEGWLDKLSPQGKHVFQKRWVKFDGESMAYYNNDKDIYSKGIILLSAIAAVRMHRDNKFEVVTAHRIFVFRAEKEEERNNWVTILFTALRSLPAISRARTAVPPEKSGYLELKGYKTKIFTLLQGNSVWICKNNQDFKSGYGITIIPMNVANVRQIDRSSKQCFEIITPYRSFSFTAESEKEKQNWIEALQQSIAETLSDYEVAEKIWFNESNRICADCKTPDPDWASINLCVVICKKCAGQHRSLGPRDSKVRSLKMDASIWTNELIELFIVIGNERSNSFWEGNLQPDEKLKVDAPADKRLTFITQKYKEGKFRKLTLLSKTKDELNKALCAAVIKTDVLETMMLLFSGADVMCATGDPVFSTPYLLAKKSGQRLQMEFLHHNKFSDFSHCDGRTNATSSPDSPLPSFLYDNLYMVSFNPSKLFSERKIKEECGKKWCVLESGFLSYYENEKMATPSGTLDIGEVICLVIHKSEDTLPMGASFGNFTLYIFNGLMNFIYRVQKCSEINLMEPHNLAMAFSSCLFQTKGQMSEEVDVVEDLIVNYVQLFDIQQDRVKQMDIENSFITKWKDTQISQAGDLLIDVYVERKEPDSSIIIRISPTMEAEELTHDVLGIKNLTPHKDDTWATFEVIENGELERPLHCTENILEQILHWSSLANPSNASLIIKKFPTVGLTGEGSKHSGSPSSPKINLEETSRGPVKAGYLKYKEEPSKLLSANKFQDRYFVLREGKLWLYKDMKSSKAEKAFPVKSLKLYLGVKKKLKPPTNWGLTLLSEKHHWYLCCDGQNSQLEWLNSIFMAQHNAMCPPSGKTRKPSITKNPKIVGLPLIPIQHHQSIPRKKASLAENSKLEPERDLVEEKTGLKERVSRVVQHKERKEEKIWNQGRKHRSLICLEDMAEDVVNLDRRSCKESKSPRRNESKARETPLESEKQLPANVLHELHAVLQRTRAFHDDT
ncbi:arf-GAP with Rho-GAP domain, ANK repeat and PH domain-containing protein 2 [Pituophis catenifer annectens]|uniref:arf-GAP with Rho-GAP domain, ANK repeat and PH domain-containing protein 2 n=1 Tax=Pituophis catenifer annectens TaxID=94852 RepID=UPI003994FC93